jgi:hypothetical protein
MSVVSDMMPGMASAIQISSLILDQLAGGEKRMLSLVVAVRNALGRSERVKGDLSEIVKAALHKLVASEVVVDVEGLYSLSPPQRRLAHRIRAVTSPLAKRDHSARS